MNFQNLLNQFTGSRTPSSSSSKGMGSGILAGSAAGGVMGLLAGNKSARKFAGKAAVVGGTALIGGIAYKAYRNWQRNSGQQVPQDFPEQSFETSTINTSLQSDEFQMTLIKAMIAAAKSDGHIDQKEQDNIFNAVEKMELDHQMKGLVFDWLRKPIYMQELIHGAQSLEQRTEVYLASCLAIDIDTDEEKQYLVKLAQGLKLPADLEHQIRIQANYALHNQPTVV